MLWTGSCPRAMDKHAQVHAYWKEVGPCPWYHAFSQAPSHFAAAQDIPRAAASFIYSSYTQMGNKTEYQKCDFKYECLGLQTKPEFKWCSSHSKFTWKQEQDKFKISPSSRKACQSFKLLLLITISWNNQILCMDVFTILFGNKDFSLQLSLFWKAVRQLIDH